MAAAVTAAQVGAAPASSTSRDAAPRSQSAAPTVLAERAEAARIAMIERAAPAVVCIFDEDERGGGSGVIIDPDGYGLTNYHVVAGMLESRRGLGGLSDGKRYPLKVLGIDPGGDVAMFRLSGRNDFPHAPLGDSDAVRVGDTAIAMGNPFLLSEDYTPTVTLGIVSGINRYQYGAGAGDTLLYSDCIQVDAAINPGNSGGPLFNLAGEVIGINGRISVSLRGRVNVGMGYAITANQIKAFMPGLRAGKLIVHGTLEAVVRDHYDGAVVFAELREPGPAWDIGVRPGDVLVRFDGRDIRSANAFASILGTLPANWPVDVTYRKSDGRVHTTVARTAPIPVPDSEGFQPDPALEQDAIARVLERFRKSITPEEIDWSEPLAYEWIESMSPQGVDLVRIPKFMVTDPGKGSVRYVSLDDRDQELLVNDDAVSLVRGESGSAVSIGLDMGLRALFAIPRVLLAATEPADLLALAHCGADRDVYEGHDCVIRRGPYECIGRTTAPDFEARYCFDPATGRLRLIRIINSITRETTKVTLHGATPFTGDILIAGPSGSTTDFWSLHREAVKTPFAISIDESAPRALVQNTSIATGTAESPSQHVLERTVKLFGAKVGRTAGYGSGAIVSSNGLVLTVDSALLDADNVRAVLHDGTICNVEPVFSDRKLQLALLRLTPSDDDAENAKHPFFVLDAELSPQAGRWVWAAGNPFRVAAGAEPASLARGVLGGRTRLDATRGTQDFPYDGPVLVIDAITSTPGFAGGPLTDGDGRLVGLVGRMVEARMTHTMLNYAVPGKVLAAFVTRALDPEARRERIEIAPRRPVYHGIKFFELGYRTNPVYVERVKRGSPAAQAGLRPDDLIIAANGKPVAQRAALEQVLATCAPGDTLTLTVVRDGAVRQIELVLAEEK